MSRATLKTDELEEIKEHVRKHDKTLVIIRTEHAPTELSPLLNSVGKACGMPLSRKTWSPQADFGFAELNSNGKILVVLWIGGARTELVSIGETDEIFIRDLEDSVYDSNFQSSLVKDGL